MVNLAIDYVEKLRTNAEQDRFRALILKREDSFKQRMYRDSNKMKAVIFNLDEG